jgi:hypothetical protein
MFSELASNQSSQTQGSESISKDIGMSKIEMDISGERKYYVVLCQPIGEDSFISDFRRKNGECYDLEIIFMRGVPLYKIRKWDREHHHFIKSGSRMVIYQDDHSLSWSWWCHKDIDMFCCREVMKIFLDRWVPIYENIIAERIVPAATVDTGEPFIRCIDEVVKMAR